jgi:transcriptional regulator with XRE-family HTH domain
MASKTRKTPPAAAQAPATGALLLGARLRALRRLQGMTVEELARAVDVDKAHISRIENNLKTPSIATMAQLARALNVTMGHLLGETLDKSAIKVTRGKALTLSQVDEPAHQFVPLIHGDAVSSFEAFVVVAGADAGQAQAQHAGQEMMFILSGTVDVMFQDHTVRMSAGDCIHFPGYLPHRLCRVGRAKAKALLVLSNG